jgi:hypothetical protein
MAAAAGGAGVTGRFGPVPEAWMNGGAPAEVRAALAEGFCPVHLVTLEQGVIRLGGRRGMPERRRAAGWCPACDCWWHLTPGGWPVATWAQSGGKAAAAGWPG